MTPKILDPTEAKAHVLKMLEHSPYVSFATQGLDGYPDVRALMVVAKDNIHSIWFAVEAESKKVAQLRSNPKAAVYGYNDAMMCEFRLFGSVELLSDIGSRQKVWKDVESYFPEGIDSMIVLRFDTDHGVYDSYGVESGKF